MSGRMNVPSAQQLRFKPVEGKRTSSTAATEAVKAAAKRDMLFKEKLAVPGLTALTAFRIIIVARFCGAMYSSIQDCDEGERVERALTSTKVHGLFPLALVHEIDPPGSSQSTITGNLCTTCGTVKGFKRGNTRRITRSGLTPTCSPTRYRSSSPSTSLTR